MKKKTARGNGYTLVRLANGACSVYAAEYDETFHPVVGPVAEAEALYVQGLNIPGRAAQAEREFVIWDVGLGAAANALTVLKHLVKLPIAARLLSFDKTLAPLEFAVEHAGELGYVRGYEAELQELITTRLVKKRLEALDLSWEAHIGNFVELISSPAASKFALPDVILYDAFSPATNPEMWTLPLFERIHGLVKSGPPCALATYSRSTMLRASLLMAGFFAGTGAATGEKEETTVAATRLELIPRPLTRSWLERAFRSTSAEPMREAVYRQERLSEDSKRRLLAHPQFKE